MPVSSSPACCGSFAISAVTKAVNTAQPGEADEDQQKTPKIAIEPTTRCADDEEAPSKRVLNPAKSVLELEIPAGLERAARHGEARDDTRGCRTLTASEPMIGTSCSTIVDHEEDEHREDPHERRRREEASSSAGSSSPPAPNVTLRPGITG